ncbi:MAG: carboxypeptidase regulatory-like domain-containing protein, partial [Bdellovibrionales bacterium]|nr:carboxypeptidase regulatory-like domain-containing protein [Bdellovibrionales bacterium]
MKRFWPRRYRKSLFRLSPFSAVLVFILSWSCKTAMVDFRGFTGSGLVIEQTKISPAWAAYEDSQSQWQSEFTSEKVNEEWGESLVSGIGPYTPEEMDGWRYGSSSLDGKRGESQIPDVYREGRLKGMVISQIAPGDTNGNPQGTLVAQVSPTSLPQVDLAGLQTEGELSFEERAQQLVAAELERRRKSENIRYIEGTRGEALKVVGSNRVNRDQGLFSSWVAPEESVSPSDGRKTFSPSQNLAKGTPHTKPGTSVQGNLDLEIEDRSIPFVLSGSFGITGGLAYVEGSMRFELIQYLFDVPLARGVIWENDARFEIAVKELRGDLELRLVDTDGRVLGSGRLQLHQLNVSPRNEMKIEDLEIILAPAPLGARIEVVSAYSIGTHSSLPVAKAKVEIQGLNRSYRTDEEGLVSDPDFLPGSNFILKVEKKDFWGSLVFGLSGETLRVPLFPNKMVSALLSLIARNDFEENEFREGSIVWGKVTQDGLPLEGAVVELAGPEELTPSYFNIAYLPDVSLKSTGTNGLFVFVGVNPGIQSVRVRLGEKVFPAKIIPTEKGFVS